MTEYIEREAALEESVELYYWCGYEDRYGYFVPVDAIQCIHAADVAPVRHGRWETNSDRPDSLICSVCKCGFDMWKHEPHNYCPNCGAKMDGEPNE